MRRPLPSLRFLLLAAALVGLVAPLPAGARERRAAPEAKQVEAVSPAAYKRLTAAQEALQNEHFAEAERILKELLRSSKLNDHEKALCHQTLGYVYSGQEQYAKAIRSFEAAQALHALPDSAQLTNQFDLGQLYMLQGRYDDGIRTLRAWFEKAENPAASAYILLANAYAQKEDYKNALKWAEDGLSRMGEPRASWTRLGAQLNLQAEHWKRAGYWLEKTIALEPGHKSDWIQLVAVYGQLDQPKKALAAMRLADLQGFVTKDKERVQLAQLYLFNEIPYRAGKVLQAGMDSGKIEKSQANWELLANAWSLAREDDRAIGPLRMAASKSKDGKLWLRLGQIQADNERWADAEQALRQAIAKGGLKEPGQAHILLGITFFERDRLKDARKAFERAASFSSTKGAARSWLDVVASREATKS